MKCKLSISGNLIITPEENIEVYAMRKWHEDNKDAAVIIRELNELDDIMKFDEKDLEKAGISEVKSSLEIKAKWILDQERSNDLVEAIGRNLSSGTKISLEWIEEFNEFCNV